MLGALAGAAILGLGAVPLSRSQTHRRSQLDKQSIEEAEEQWVRLQIHRLRARRRACSKVIAEFAKATGPWAHRFGYGPHPGNRERARRLRQQAAREAKRRK